MKKNFDIPLVSVIIPVYNAKHFIVTAIESALRQDVSMEVIIVDDNSSDHLKKHIEKYLEDERFIYLKNPSNCGTAFSRNMGIQKARGKYIAFLDADDWWEKDKLKRQLALIEANNAVLCCTAREMVSHTGESTGKVIPVAERITYRMLLRHNSINCSSVLICAKIAKMYPMEHDDAHEDYFTWLRILRSHGDACAINEPLLKYRLSKNSKSGNKIKSAKMTFRVYRYMNINFISSLYYLCSYMVHGIAKHYM